MFMPKKWILWVIPLLLTVCQSASWARNAPPATPSRAVLAERLNYLVNVRNFSKSRPLTQAQLMEFLHDLGGWGAFPKSYRVSERMEGCGSCESYITRPGARRFVRELLGQDLKVWHPSKSNHNPRLVGDKMGWWFNTANSMYERPTVRILRITPVKGKGVTARFQVLHRAGTMIFGAKPKRIGTGRAQMERIGGNWVVTSWQADHPRL